MRGMTLSERDRPQASQKWNENVKIIKQNSLEYNKKNRDWLGL